MDYWRTYYAMKNRLGGNKLTGREKLCFHWCPTPGCNMHKDIIGTRKGEILFKKYYKIGNHKANLLYWRMHPKEWTGIQRRVKM